MSSLSRLAAGLVSPPRRPTVLGADLSAFSTSPSQLQEVTMDATDMSMPISRSPAHGSPSHGCSMKEYEEQLAALRKENFNLKLRVYFLEERLDVSNTPAEQHNLIKKNIELKVSLEGLRREVGEKEALLCAAARALEMVETAAARKESELLARLQAFEEELCSVQESSTLNAVLCAVSEPNIDCASVPLAADDSVALYAAAFNLHPTASELRSFNKKQANPSSCANPVCDCRQLRRMLEEEREAARLLQDTVSERDLVIADQEQKIQEYSESCKTLQNMESCKNKDDMEFCKNMKDMEPSTSLLKRDDDTPDFFEQRHQLEMIKTENKNAFQMVQGCLIRLKRMDRDNKKLMASLQKKEERIVLLSDRLKHTESLQLPRESIQSVIGSGDDSEGGVVRQYNDLIGSQDECLSDFEEKLKMMLSMSRNSDLTKLSSLSDEKEMELLTSFIENNDELFTKEKKAVKQDNEDDKHTKLVENVSCDGNTEHKNIQEMLSSRLQEMAYFLDSLLSHRCVLGEDKRKKVERLLEQSLELPVGLKLDPEASRLLEHTFMDASITSMSQSFRLEDLTKLFGHHMSFSDETALSHKAKHKSSQETVEIELKKMLSHQEQVIDRLSNQLMNVRSRCICGSTAAEDSDEIFASLNSKTSFCEYNKMCTRKNRHKNGRARANVNTTWHGSGIPPQDHSESECWSEPDRNVSLARMGGPLQPATDAILSSEDDCPCSHPSLSPCKTSENVKFRDMENYIKLLTKEKCRADRLLEDANTKIVSLENELEINRTLYNVDMKSKQDEINILTQKLDEAENAVNRISDKHQTILDQFEKEKIDMQEKVIAARSQTSEAVAKFKEEVKRREDLDKTHRHQMEIAAEASDRRLREIQEKVELEWVSRSRYESLRKEADNAALLSSQATLDRALATEQRMRSDSEAERMNRCLTSARVRLSELETHCAELQNRLVYMEAWQGSARSPPSPGPVGRSPPRTASPDQGIDSDRLSSLELAEPIPSKDNRSSQDIVAENALLRERLERTQHNLKGALVQLNASNSRKRKEQKAICQEIHKTHSVLRQVRDNLIADP